MADLQTKGDMTQLMILQEAVKTAPFGDIWSEYLRREGVCEDYYPEIKAYEDTVLSKRA